MSFSSCATTGKNRAGFVSSLLCGALTLTLSGGVVIFSGGDAVAQGMNTDLDRQEVLPTQTFTGASPIVDREDGTKNGGLGDGRGERNYVGCSDSRDGQRTNCRVREPGGPGANQDDNGLTWVHPGPALRGGEEFDRWGPHRPTHVCVHLLSGYVKCGPS